MSDITTKALIEKLDLHQKADIFLEKLSLNDLRKLSVETGLGFSWLRAMKRKAIPEPSALKLEKLLNGLKTRK